MEVIYTDAEIRVLGVLMEKEMTTPEYYPLTANGIRTASNQKSNRNPVVNFDDDFIMDTLQSLRKKEMLITVTTSGSRTRKYEHRMKQTYFLSKKESALLSVLMLRGPQTIGELRTRTDRMVTFESLISVEETLKDLAMPERKPYSLVQKLPVWPGQKEARYIHLFSGKPDLEAIQKSFTSPMPSVSTGGSRVTLLEEKVTALEKELEALKEEFKTFRTQFE